MENIYTDHKFDLGVKGLNQQYDTLDPINSNWKESNVIWIINCDKLFQICEFFIFSGTWYVKIHTKWI